MEYASKGVAGTGLGLGAAALGVNLLNGNLGNLLGGNCGMPANAACSENMAVNRYEMNMQKEIINRDSEIAYLKGRDAAKTDSLELYRYIDGKFACVERELADQRTYNAVNTTNISCLSGQVAQLMGLTKMIIPATNICPEPMKLYNSWTAPTTTTTGA
jgi:hypothetical protein